jgi:hypothetical protein
MLNLEPIKARLAAATPETWKSTSFADQYADKYGAWIPSKGWYSQVSGPMWHEKWPGGWAACVDADLIANAPTDLAALVAEVERLRGHVKTADALRLEAAQEHGKERRHWADERHRFAEERIKLVSDYWRIREAVVRHRREAQAVNILNEPALADARLWAEVLGDA